MASTQYNPGFDYEGRNVGLYKELKLKLQDFGRNECGVINRD
jgi:hypothetical protein